MNCNAMINMVNKYRSNIKNIFQRTLDCNLSSKIVHDYVNKLYSGMDNIHVIAIGKAASAMLEGAISSLGSKLSGALLITKQNHVSVQILNNSRIETIIAGHPIPDENSLYAGECLIQYIQELKNDDHILFLISGGTSSLVEYIPHTISGLIIIR